MPARTRRSTAAPTNGNEDVASSPPTPDQAMQSSPAAPPSQPMNSGLQFNQSLSWRAGRPPLVADLLKRLQNLNEELRKMDQEGVDDGVKASLSKIGRELAEAQLLGHKDKGIRAWVGCCVVDILRLCAPDAPYTLKQLKAIFEMISKSILPALSDPSNAYNAQHIYVLSSLAQVKSIVLAADLPGAASIVTHIFTTFFDILSGSTKASTGESISKAVQFHMTSILVTIIDESSILPQDAVDIVIAQFLRVDPRALNVGNDKLKKGSTDTNQPTLAIKELSPAYMMAKTVCLSCQEKMAREISKYFNDVIMDASGASGDRRNSADADDLDASLNGPDEIQLKELEKAHRLLRELWRACPFVLQNVIPQLEAELGAENVQLRVLATETLGDIASGIGAAGPPAAPTMDPAAYPPPDLMSSEQHLNENPLTKPTSTQSFTQVHGPAYSAFLSRKQDKAPLVRSAWALAIGYILVTNAGGMGLSPEDELRLVEDMARMLNDGDEKVRLSAVKAVGLFGLKDVISKLGLSGSVEKPGSVLGNLAERVKDRKAAVRLEAMHVCGRIWSAAIGEISVGNNTAQELLGGIPSKILNTYYTNDLEISVLMDKVLFEVLLPLQYPPIKSKTKVVTSSSQRMNDSQGQTHSDAVVALNPDRIRAERILLFAKGLDERAKKIFFALSARQLSMTRYIQTYLQACEDYNGGVMDSNEIVIKERLKKLINELTKLLPDSTKVSADLWKFAKTHDRRAYQLIRFGYSPESDYRTVYNAIKEFSKRIDASLKDTLLPLVYRTSVILYNRSHVPAILDCSRSNEGTLSSIAHEVLTDISQRIPEVLKAQVRDICVRLQDDAPSATRSNSPDAVNDLKACASFARKFANEIPQDRKFVQAMASFAMFGTPPEAAKYAVSIVMMASNKKEMIAKDLAQKLSKSLEFGKPGFLSRLATISQLWVMAPEEVNKVSDGIINTVTEEILLKVRNPSTVMPSEYTWSNDLDEECAAKCWAIKILVNQVRSHTTPSTLGQVAEPVYKLLNSLVQGEGELSKKQDTPSTHRSRLRLVASRSLLKMCLSKNHDALFSPQSFQRLAEIALDPIFEVRNSFFGRLKKYLSKNSLPARYYTIPFLLAYEPQPSFKSETITWIRSRAVVFASQQATSDDGENKAAGKKPTILENVFSRLLSLLAHFTDYGDDPEDLVEACVYLVFYLATVANDKNISLIYHIAQRVKTAQDCVGATEREDDIDYSRRLHTLSDLATHAIRTFLETHNWTLQTLPGRISLPGSLFKEIKDHKTAVDIAAQNFLPEGIENGVEAIVKQSMKKGGLITLPNALSNKKRKSEADIDIAAKKTKSSKLPVRERDVQEKPKKQSKRKARDWDDEDGNTPVKSRAEIYSRRKSGRASLASAQKSYRERDDSEDDAEMEEANEEEGSDEEDDSDEEDENQAEPNERTDDSHNEEEALEVNGDADMKMRDVNEAAESPSPKPPSSPPSTRRSARRGAAVSADVNSTPSRSSARTPHSKRSKPVTSSATKSGLRTSTRAKVALSSSSPAPTSVKAKKSALKGGAVAMPASRGKATRSKT